MQEIKYIKQDKSILSPNYSTVGSAGIDFYSPIDITINKGQDVLIDLGIIVELPKEYCLLLVNKSGIALHKKLILGACLIDSDYRGNIHAHLFNLGSKVSIVRHEKICQGILIPCGDAQTIELQEVDELTDTDRGAGGFGSTNNDDESPEYLL